jgi:hypothetical protein
VRLDDPSARVQTQPRAGGARGDARRTVEAVEDPIGFIGLQADTAVAYREHRLTVARRQLDVDASRAVLQRVADEVADHALHLIAVDDGDGRLVRDGERETPAMADPGEALTHQLGEIRGREL